SGIKRSRIQSLGPRVGEVVSHTVREAVLDLRFQRVVRGEVVGIEDVQAAGGTIPRVLRIRDEEDRPACNGGDGLRALQTSGNLSCQVGDRIQAEWRRIE